MTQDNVKNNIVSNGFIELGKEEGKGKGRYFQSRFIEPGIAHYDEFGDVLITKETLDKFIQTIVGCPVIINHKDVDDSNVDKLRVGTISRVWFNDGDGWYYCEGILTDAQAIDLIKNENWSVSCSYDFVSDNMKKTYHGKDIDMEFIDGEFLHLAIVENPRYERATIVVNSKDFKEEEHPRKENGEFDNKDEGNLLKYPDSTISPYYKEAKEIIEKTNKPIFENISDETKKQHEKLIEKYPEAKIKEIVSKKMEEGVHGEAVTIKDNNSSVIFIDENKEQKANYFDQQWRNSISKNIYNYTHEFGHALTNLLPNEFFDKIDEIRKKHKEVSEETGIYGEDFISFYANEKAPEFFAECFTYNELNNKENKYVKEAMNLYNKYKNKANNSKEKENSIMSVMDDLKSFILAVVKNEAEKEEKKMEDEEKFEEEKDIATNEDDEEEKEEVKNKCKNEEEDKKEEVENEDDEEEEKVENEEDKEEADNEEEDKEEEEKAENKCAKNSMDKIKEAIEGGRVEEKSFASYSSQAERLALGNKF